MEFTVNPRVNPYANFRFRVKFGPRYVAGVSKVSALKRTTDVIKHRDGASSATVYKQPGQSDYEAVTLSRGLSHDPEFARWANKVWDRRNTRGSEVSLADFRRDLTIEVHNEAGQVVLAYNLYRCWVSEYQALPELDASANAVAIETLKIEYEGFDRDEAVAEPKEPTVG